MRRTLTSLTQLAVCLILLPATLSGAEGKKADPTGTWTWSQQGRDGGQARTMTLKLKLEGDKLSGTVSGRQNDTAIEEAKLNGDEISFKVTRETQSGNKMTQKFAGKISGDTIKGKIEFERNGQAQSRDWEAKREAAKPKEPAK